jgi:transcription elongation GreA/GreB family factor
LGERPDTAESRAAEVPPVKCLERRASVSGRWAVCSGKEKGLLFNPMSRAFTKETAESAPPPERMVEEGPNPVTPEGMAQIDAHITRLETAMQTETNVLLRETMARDLRYWTIRKSTAEVVQPVIDGTVTFGSTVTITRKGRTQSFRIVGVDEADASKGLISFRAPLAAAVLGARVGDIIEAAEPLGEMEINRLAS